MKNICFVLILFCFFSCQNRSESDGYAWSYDKSSQTSVEMAPEANYEDQGLTKESRDSYNPADRKIIKTADIRAEVKDLQTTAAKIEAKVKHHQGFISNVSYNNSYHTMEASFSIRIPYGRFDTLLNDLGEEALYVDYKNIIANDVTEEYRDVETRLQTKRTVRDRYVEVLKNKAKTVEEIILAEETIRTIQEEIESKEGRLKYLKDQVSLSTINLNIYQNISGPVAKQPGFFKKIGRAFANGWETFLEILIGLVSIWPILFILALFLYLFYRYRQSLK